MKIFKGDNMQNDFVKKEIVNYFTNALIFCGIAFIYISLKSPNSALIYSFYYNRVILFLGGLYYIYSLRKTISFYNSTCAMIRLNSIKYVL